MHFLEHRVHNTLQRQRPDSWLQLAHLAGQMMVQHNDCAEALGVKAVALAEGRVVADPAAARRVLQTALRSRLGARNQALHIYRGASAAGFDYPKADFSKAALPQRLREAEVTGGMLRHFVHAGQWLVVAQQVKQVPSLAQMAQDRATAKLEAAHRHLFVHHPLRVRPLPLLPVTVLALVGLEVPGINRVSLERIKLAQHPRLTGG